MKSGFEVSPAAAVGELVRPFGEVKGISMGWQSDWLYNLIFDEVERIWKRALRDGRGQFGPAPTVFVI